MILRHACAAAGALFSVGAAHAQVVGSNDNAAQAAAAPASESYPAAAAGDGNTVGGYNQSRWAEDWSALRDPAKRDDPLDALKFIPSKATTGST